MQELGYRFKRLPAHLGVQPLMKLAGADECATLWELADNTTEPKILSELSVSKYLEVRDAVIRRKNKA